MVSPDLTINNPSGVSSSDRGVFRSFGLMARDAKSCSLDSPAIETRASSFGEFAIASSMFLGIGANKNFERK
jgi:hypothetical protein